MSIKFVKISRNTSESLNRLRSEIHPDNWERITDEIASRRKFQKTKGMTEELIDAAILGVIQARNDRQEDVVYAPILGKDGSIHCVICNNFPVVCVVIIPADTRTGQGQENTPNFVSFICNYHAINPEIAESEIQRRNVWVRLFELQNKYKKEENDIPK